MSLGPEIELRYQSKSSQFLLGDNTQDESAADVTSDAIRQHTASVLTQLMTWQNVAETSKDEPDVIVEFLLKIHQHELTRKWINIYKYVEFISLVDESQVVFLLEKNGERNLTDAMILIENSFDKSVNDCKVLCYNLIAQFNNKQNTAIVAEFMLLEMQGHLESVEIAYLEQLIVGCKALEFLPNSMKSDYDHLIGEPLLLLEQLLMNLKVRFVPFLSEMKIKPSLIL